MKLKSFDVEKLSKAMETKRRVLGLSYAGIGKKCGVDQGQVSRICRGEFKTHSASVMLICNVLEISTRPTAAGSARLQDALFALWDGTDADAEHIANMLCAIAALRERTP